MTRRLIVSFVLPDGTYPEVGMNHRYITRLKTVKGWCNEAQRSCHAKPGRLFRVSDFETDELLYTGCTT